MIGDLRDGDAIARSRRRSARRRVLRLLDARMVSATREKSAMVEKRAMLPSAVFVD
jgi:hypothetical protein